MSRILIVDDRATNREYLTTLLNYGGHRLFEAADGAEALRLVRDERPDLVISDILMPTMDGFEFVKNVRAEPAIANTKIVFYTATYRADEARQLATACGVSAVIAKPADPQRVLDVVNEQLGSAAPQLISQLAIKPVAELAQNLAKLHTTSARLYAMVELGMNLSAERDPQRLLQTFASAARRILGSRSVVALLLHPTEKRKRHAATEGLAPEAVTAMDSLVLDQGLVAQLLAARKPIRLVAGRGEKTVRGLPVGHPATKSFLGVAIGTGSRCHGFAFCTDKLGGPSEFNEEDEQLAQALAAQLAVIYENFELYDMLQRHAAELHVEVVRREQVQAALAENERGLHRAQLMARLAHVITGPDGSFERWSETLPQLIGVEPAKLPGTTRAWLDLLHPDDQSMFRAKAIEAGVRRERADVEYRLRRPNGEWIQVRQTMEPLRVDGDAAGASHWFNTLQDITAQRRIEENLRESESRFRQIAENIRSVFFLVDAQTNGTLYLSPAFEEIWGRSRESVYANTDAWTDAIHPDDRAATFESYKKGMSVGRFEYEYRVVRPDASIRWVEARGFPVHDESGRIVRIAGVAEDITERKLAELKIRRLNRVYAVLSQINMLIVRVRDREELFRESCRIAVEAGKFTFAWVAAVDRNAMQLRPVARAGDDRNFLADIQSRLSVGESGSEGQAMVARATLAKQAMFSNDVANDPRILFKDEHARCGTGSLAVLPLFLSGEVAGIFTLHSAERGFFDDEEIKLLNELAGDISFALDHIEKAQKLDYLAYYDELTGLANRRLFLERVGQKLLMARAAARKVALFVLDVERFKSVNDALGRQAGDELLKQIAERMKQAGADDTRLARLAADHFATVLSDVENEEQLARFTERRLEQCFATPFRIGEREIRVSARLGIAVFPNDGDDAETLFRNAEAAVKKAKAGGERYVFYTPQMTERIAEKLSLETKLRQALERDEFVLHYQPKVDLETRSIMGVEALIRWQSPDKGLVPPAHFIPLLEETGLILQVGSWALNRAARDHRSWVDQKLKAPRVAVNVSAIQLRQRDFVGVVEQAILDGLAPTAIDLEITESLVMEDIKGNIEKLKAVRALGVNIAIDDFGTGYSSLGYLAQLPVQSLKIDRSFIIKMGDDPNAMTLVSTIISLAHSLRLKVIAEGVETEDQAKFLRLLRCDEMQGYLFSKPVPAAAIVTMLRKTSNAVEVTP